MKIVSLLGMLGVVLGLAPFQTAQAAKPDPSKMITIVALGDSLTDGYILSRKQAYPALIAEKMKSANYRFEVVNADRAGTTRSDGLRAVASSSSAKGDECPILAGDQRCFRGAIEQMRSISRRSSIKRAARHPNVSISSPECSSVGVERWLCAVVGKCLARWPKKRRADPHLRKAWRRPRLTMSTHHPNAPARPPGRECLAACLSRSVKESDSTDRRLRIRSAF